MNDNLKNRKGKRILALLLALSMMLPNTGYVQAAENTSYTGYLSLSVDNYNQDMYIYSNLYYNNAANEIINSGGSGYSLTGTNPATTESQKISIYIGDNPIDGNVNTNPQASDINACLNGLTLEQDIIISPVYAQAENVRQTVNMGVIGNKSTVGGLILNDEATMTMNVESDLEVGNLELAKDSVLTVSVANGATFTINELSGAGSLIVNEGRGTLAIKKGSVKSLKATNANLQVTESLHITNDVTFYNTKITGTESAKVTSDGDFTVTGGSIDTFALFGYDTNAEGSKKITFDSGTTLTGVKTLGIAATALDASVTIDGIETLGTIGGTKFISDFTIQYLHNNEDITNTYDVSAYRVSYSSKSKTIDATDTILGVIKAGTLNEDTSLPEYEESGYTFHGWHINNSSDTYKNLIKDNRPVITTADNLVLTTSVTADSVSVTFDHGFELNEYSHECDKGKEWSITTDVEGNPIAVGSVIDISDRPTRFGWKFAGWKITTGSGNTTLSKDANTYKIVFDDLTKKADSETYLLDIEAVWERETYPFRLSLVSDKVDIAYISISFDGGNTWIPMTDITSQPEHGEKYKWDATEKYFSFPGKQVTYGDTLAEFFKSIDENYTIPLLKDNRIASEAQVFSAWSTRKGTILEETTRFENTPGGLLDSRGDDQTLEQYSSSLQDAPTTLLPKWGAMEFDVTISKMDGWDVFVDGVQLTDDNLNEENQYTSKIIAGAEVVLSTSIQNVNTASNWSATGQNDQPYYLKEEAYHLGDSELRYTLVMPKQDVEIIYNDADTAQYYFDISKSPITFEENYTFNGLNRNGFWYNYLAQETGHTPLFALLKNGETKQLSELEPDDNDNIKTYFYTWNSDNFHVTSSGTPTDNQLTLTNAKTVYMKDCVMTARDTYAELVNRTADADIKNQDLAEYANVVLSTDYHPAYITELKIEGDGNTIHCVAMSNYKISSEDKLGLNMTGTSTDTRNKLSIDSIYISYKTNLKNLDITVPDVENHTKFFIYGFTTIADYNDTTVTNCNLNIPDKDISLEFGEIQFLRGSTAEVNNVDFYGDFKVAGTDGYVHVNGNLVGNYNTVVLTDSASLVVEGNVERSWVHATAIGNINTTGCLIVKGGVLEFSCLEMSQGTVIANIITVGNRCNITGGTIVTNMITNKTTSGAQAELVTSDRYPFDTYSQMAALDTSWIFTDQAKIYLFGYYNTTSDGKKFDKNVRADSEDNPIQPIIAEMENGGITSDLQDKIAEYAAESKEANRTLECFALGNSSYTKGIDTDGRFRSVEISGDAEVYAAGNAVFYNETNITENANVTVHGNLGSKRDMTIDGSPNIYAASISNGGNLTYADSSNNNRWAETILKSGNIHTDSLGYDNDKNTTLVVEEGVSVEPWKTETVNVVQDICINYIYGNDFTVENNLKQDNVRFLGEWNNGFPTAMTTKDDGKTFAPVTITANEQEAKWHYGSLLGEEVTAIPADGVLLDKAAFITSKTEGQLYEQIDLYAVRDTYTLSVKELDDGKTVVLGENDSLANGYTRELRFGEEYTLTLGNRADVHKTVLWYQDPNGNLHNVNPVMNEDTGKVTFTMPASNVELYITESLPLDLAYYSLAFYDESFWAELTNTRDDSSFNYQGSYVVTQSDLNETINTMSIRESFTNGQTLTINGLNQKIRKKHGIELYDNVKSTLYVDGDNTISFIHVPYSADITICGKNADAEKKDTLRLYQYSSESNGNDGNVNLVAIGTYSGEAGNVTIQDLHLIKKEKGTKLIASATKTEKSVTLTNVFYDDYETEEHASYNSGHFIAKYTNVKIERNSDFRFIGKTDYQPRIFNTCINVTIVDSHIKQQETGSKNSAGANIFQSVTGSFYIEGDSTVDITYRNSTSSDTYHESLYPATSYPTVVRVSDTSKLTVEGRLTLVGNLTSEARKGLQVTDNAAVKVTGTDSTSSYLLCNELTVSDEARVDADYIIVSAFTWPNATEDVNNATKGEKALFETWASQESDKDREDAGVLTQTGGTITADQIGGAYGAELNFSGGTVYANKIGTLDAIFGYASVIPPVDEEPVYQYALAPSECSSEINITGGIVHVGTDGYLGGHNSQVNISGGQVSLGDNSVLGLTENQREDAVNDATSKKLDPANVITGHVMIGNGATVEGENAQILRPYSTLQISDTATAVKVRNIIADYGQIIISDAKGIYDLGDLTEDDAGVYISETLSAQTILVDDYAIVYADKMESVIPADASGGIKVSDNALVYTNAYGVRGEGASGENISEENGGDIICFTRIVEITYVMKDDEIDPAGYKEGESNPSTYEQQAGTEIDLVDPIRHGYEFGGWYMTEDCTGRQIETIDRGTTAPITLYAKWIPKTVEFKVIFDGDLTDPTVDLTKDAAELAPYGTIDETNNTLSYSKTFHVAYRSHLQSKDGIVLDELLLPMWSIMTLRYYDKDRNPVPVEIDGTIVDSYMYDTYTNDNTPFELYVSVVNKTRQKVTFDLNLKNNLPVDTKFISGKTYDSTSTTRSSYVDYGSKVQTGDGFRDDAGNFISAVAPGYEFLGWSKTRDGDPIENLGEQILDKNTADVYYAQWQAKEYKITFNAVREGAESDEISQITKSRTIEPTDSDTFELTGTIFYDEVLDGNLNWGDDLDNSLPAAWTKGFKFDRWVVNGTEIDANSVFNKSSFDFNEEAGVTGGNPTENALTITAVYSPVKITYVTNGGLLKGRAAEEKAVPLTKYGDPLIGYSKTESSSDLEETFDTYSRVGDYAVYSTKAAYYAANNNYAIVGDVADYRNEIIKKGYTFYGWFTSNDAATAAAAGDGTVVTNAVVSVPAYEDVTVYAAWHANTYELKLNAVKAGKNYPYTAFSHTDISGDGALSATVIVGQKIDPDISGVNLGNWPERSGDGSWYAYNNDTNNPGEDSKRYLLGFTFGALDPGSTTGAGENTYKAYGGYVTQLYNDKTLFVKEESDFFLPENYSAGDVNNIPDYPEGSQIPMYAVYRERSLVFYEYYLDTKENIIKETEMAAYPYKSDEYRDYPAAYASEYKEAIEKEYGYKLKGWYLHQPEAIELYPADLEAYNQMVNNYISAGGTNNQSYDIKVYTVYIPAVSITGQKLTGDGKSTGTNYSEKIEYTIPASIQSGVMNYAVRYNEGVEDEDKLQFVASDYLNEENENRRYLNEIEDGKTADNTVAIDMVLRSPDGEHIERVSLGNDGTFTLTAAKDYTITLELYTSKVVSTNKAYTIDVVLGFANDADQSITFENLQVQMVPSKYKVVYDSNLPTNDPAMDVTYEEGVTVSSADHVAENVAYGSELLKAPHITGYESVPWYQTINDSAVADSNFAGTHLNPQIEEDTLTVDNDCGVIYLKTDWSTKDYNLFIDDSVLAYWNVAYQPIDADSPIAYVQNEANGVDIPYHSEVIFTSKEVDSYYLYKEFVSLDMIDPSDKTLKSTTNLLLHEDPVNSNQFKMEAEDVKAVFIDERTLYLEDDHISISEDEYVHKDETVVWHGKYIIQMNAKNNATEATEHVLTLNGKLGERIKLGNLNISSDNSIVMSENASATLTLKEDTTVVEGKNILVPATAELILSNGTVKMSPSEQYAGIGDVNGNGKIILNNLTVDLLLSAYSEASGIGSFISESEGEDITINDCTVSVSQKKVEGQSYKGVWIGGANVATVNFNGSKLIQKDDSDTPVNSYAFNGLTVNISNGSEVHTGATVYAKTELNITNSEILQAINTQVARTPIGTDPEGTVTVNNSKVETTVNDGYWANRSNREFYTGKMIIKDAASNVVIDDNRFIEVGNGDVTITSEGYTQDGNSPEHTGDYVLLGNANANTNSSLTVKADADIYLDIYTDDVNLSAISFEGNPTFTGAAGRKLLVSGDFAGYGNLTLNNITVEATGKLGSYGSNETAPEGSLTPIPKTVAINGTSSIKAVEIGALGTHNDTFVFVNISDTAGIDGTVFADHYRMEYQYENGYDISGLNTVYRSERTYTESEAGEETAVGGNVPANPVDDPIFRTWYYRVGDQFYALSDAEETVDGYDDNAVLTSTFPEGADKTELNADGTRTLLIYADAKVEGTVSLKDGRWFTKTGFVESTSITIPDNSSFTALLTAKGATMPGGEYQFRFGDDTPYKLPQGTKLTLTILKDGVAAEYYYYIAQGDETSVNASEFIKMGTTDTNLTLPKPEEMSPTHIDEMLLAFDFLNSEAVPAADQKVSFYFVKGTSYEGEICNFTYTLEENVNGTVDARRTNITEGEVTVTLPSNSVYEGKNYVMIAEITEATVPYDASVTLGDQIGTAVDGNKFVFDVNSQDVNSFIKEFAVNGMNSTYKVTWKLAVKGSDDSANVFDTILATSDTLTFGSEAESLHLKLNVQSIDGGAVASNKRTLEAGKSHTVVFGYDTNSTDVAAVVQVQNHFLANFGTYENCTIDTVSKTFTVTFSGDEGVYRIAASLNGNSFDDNDNDYIAFVITE